MVGDQGEKLCQNHRIPYPTPLEWIQWATGNKAGIRKTTFLDVLFLREHPGSGAENGAEVRQEAGLRKGSESREDWVNEGSALELQEVNTFK